MARSYTTVFFDLDGTLLPMDTDVFMKRYFKARSLRKTGSTPTCAWAR